MAKKTVYICLSALLGALLFFILHRLAVFFYLYLLSNNYITTDLSYLQFLALDYFSLLLVVALGLWYGVWLGRHWFRKVYEDRTHAGFIDHLSRQLFISTPKTLGSRMAVVRERLETDLMALENVTKTPIMNVRVPEAKVKKVVRRRAPKKPAAMKKSAKELPHDF